MDARLRDLQEHIESLRALLSAEFQEALVDRARRAGIAVAFRRADGALGLSPVDSALVDDLHLLVEAAFTRAAARLPEAWRYLAEYRLEVEDGPGAADAYSRAASAGETDCFARAAATIWEFRLESLAADAHKFAAKAGAEGEYLLGIFSFNAFGTKKDDVVSRAYHESAAAGGNADAMFELYAMTSQGLGGLKSDEIAIQWCRRAAEAGNVRAMANLGTFYATGNGVNRSPANSAHWYDRAARAGHGKAAATLGCMYALGDELEQDSAKARAYFTLADKLAFDWRTLADAVGLDPTEWDD